MHYIKNHGSYVLIGNINKNVKITDPVDGKVVWEKYVARQWFIIFWFKHKRWVQRYEQSANHRSRKNDEKN